MVQDVVILVAVLALFALLFIILFVFRTTAAAVENGSEPDIEESSEIVVDRILPIDDDDDHTLIVNPVPPPPLPVLRQYPDAVRGTSSLAREVRLHPDGKWIETGRMVRLGTAAHQEIIDKEGHAVKLRDGKVIENG